MCKGNFISETTYYYYFLVEVVVISRLNTGVLPAVNLTAILLSKQHTIFRVTIRSWHIMKKQNKKPSMTDRPITVVSQTLPDAEAFAFLDMNRSNNQHFSPPLETSLSSYDPDVTPDRGSPSILSSNVPSTAKDWPHVWANGKVEN